VRTISAGAMRALTQLPWLGNVRQLQHAVERAVLTGAGSYLTEKDFEGLLSAPVHTIDATFDLASVTKQAVRTAECARIHEALRHAKGSKAAAARLLNISRASLYIKLREYRIPHPLD
jgi:DNA-binding NtrC family response regulator